MNRRKFLYGAASIAATRPSLIARAAPAQTSRVRRDATGLLTNDPFFLKYADAIKRMHALPATDPRNWRNQALIHLNHCPHSMPDFFHWHRHYITYFEKICGELIGDPTFALAYWNWTNKRGQIPDPFYTTNELNVEFWKDVSNSSSPHWAMGRLVNTGPSRALARGQGLMDRTDAGGPEFALAKVEATQKITDFTVYRPLLEGTTHNIAHSLVGAGTGHMGNGLSPLDPIFWLHHCNVDRLWARWQAAGNTTPATAGTYNGYFSDMSGKLTSADAAGALDIGKLGYTYDDIVAPNIDAAARRLNLPSVENQQILDPKAVNRAPEILGEVRKTQAVITSVESHYDVAVTNLLPGLSQSRTFWATNFLTVKRLALEPSRMIARISDVSPPEATSPFLVNVFINCPYLSPATPATDPLCAGTFSFFDTHLMANSSPEFIVDITSVVRGLAQQGGIATNNIRVQFMAVPVSKEDQVRNQFSVGRVEILTI